MTANNPVFYLNYGNGSSTGYYAVGAWVAATAKNVGDFIRQTAPAVASERLFICVVAGTTHATTEPTWVLTKGAKTTDNTITWMECTGMAATNNDTTNTQAWASAAGSRALGDIIKNVAGTYLFIYTTAGTGKTGTEPVWDTTTGNTTADNTATVTCIGATGAFANWANPGARLITLNKTGWTTSGNTVYVAKAHAETQSTSNTVASTGDANRPVRVICVDQAGSVPPVAADVQTTPQASVTVSGANDIVLSGSSYFSGITFSSAETANSGINVGAVNNVNMYKNCAFVLSAASGTAYVDSNASSYTTLDNCTFSFSQVGQAIRLSSATWKNTTSALLGAAVPTIVFSATKNLIVDGVDLSAAGAGKTLFPTSTAWNCSVVNCRLGASVTFCGALTTGSPNDLINSDSGATGYRQERHHVSGVLTTETTYVRAASDGVQTISWKIASNASASIINPFQSFQIVAWVSSTGSKTATVEIENGGVTLTNAEVWMDVEYLGSASYPVGSFISTGVATPLTAGTNITTSTPTPDWSGSLGSAVKQKMVTGSFTVNTVGLVRATVYVARPSLTLYVDPVLTIA